MKLMKTLRMFGIAGALLGSVVTQSFALPANEVETWYYSDATLTEEVGYTLLSCSGGIYREGRRTQYAVRFTDPC